MASADVRVRRPREHEFLLDRLQDDAGFPTKRDALLFAAALGVSAERNVPFSDSGEPIRYEIMVDRPFAVTLFNMIAAVSAEGEAEILDGERLQERVTLFEGYSNGGLNLLQELLNTRHQSLDALVQSLVVDHLADAKARTAADVSDLLLAVDW